MMSKSNAFGLLLAGLLFGLVFSIASALPQMPEETNTGAELRKSSGEVYQNVSDLRLASEKTAKRAGESLSTLLARNGVKFGGSSVSLFYELNPDITDFGSLPVGTVINV